MTLAIRNQAAHLGVLCCHVILVTLAAAFCLHQLETSQPLVIPLMTLFVVAAALGGALAEHKTATWLPQVNSFLLPLTLGVSAGMIFAMAIPTIGLGTPATIMVALLAAIATAFTSCYGLDFGVRRALKPADLTWSILVIGSNRRTQGLIEKWLGQTRACSHIIGYLDATDRMDADNRDPIQGKWKFLGDISEIKRILSSEIIDEVWLTLPARSCHEKIQAVLDACETVGVAVRMPAAMFDLGESSTRQVGGGNVDDLYFQTTGGKPWQFLVKRVFDVAFSSFLLIVLSPVLLACIIAIKITSKGPAFFTQDRCGLHGRRFKLLKFRSMVMDAEVRKDEVAHLNEVSGPVFKCKRDPRITRVGHFLRRASLDELPQLINILRGEMSLVGPRPPVPKEVAVYESWQRRRLSVVPGLTCVWQVSGRSNIPFDQWMKLDLQYAANWSLRLDFLLLLKTIPAVLFMRGAH